MLYTDNLNLKKPEENEFYDVNNFNSNADIIDAAIQALQDGKADAEDYLKLTGGTITGDLNITGNLKVKNKHVITSVNNVTANDDGAITIAIPEQVQPDWNATSGKGQILNKPTLASVATSGSYNDLSNKPSIPTVTIATQAEAEAGTNNTKHMTPLRVKQAIEALDGNPIVSASISGKTITLTKKDGTKITLTTQDTNTSNWSVSKGTNGWARDNSTGFTIQWGFWEITKGGNISTTITFPRTFTAVYGATTNGKNTNANWYPANDTNAVVTNLTTSSLTLRQSGDDQIVSIYWTALGIS